MDNFDNLNNEIKNDNGNIEGFDAAVPEREETAGYYSRSKDEIIQDEARSSGGFKSETGGFSQNFDGQDFSSYNNNGNFVKPPKKEKRGYSAAIVVLSCVLAAAIGAAGALGANFWLAKQNTSSTSQGNSNLPQSNISINVEETALSTAEAVSKKASESVVGIRTVTSVMSFFGGSSDKTGEGSGVVYSADGYIVTNYHVIEEAVSAGDSAKIEVFVGNKDTESYSAKVIGYNISYDLAILKIDAAGLVPAERGDSEELKVGQYVVTIGAPGGLEFMGSVTYGIISGLDRVISTGSEVSLIQTDAAINPGNSGGALLDANGRLIGINSAKIVSEEFEGMGFAIPINTVVEKCDKIIARQNSPEPYTGITVSETYTSEVLYYYGFPSGAVVLRVDADSPASRAGIARGDIITAFDGKAINEYTQLSEYINDCEPDQKVTLKVYRNGKEYNVDMEIGSNG